MLNGRRFPAALYLVVLLFSLRLSAAEPPPAVTVYPAHPTNRS